MWTYYVQKQIINKTLGLPKMPKPNLARYEEFASAAFTQFQASRDLMYSIDSAQHLELSRTEATCEPTIPESISTAMLHVATANLALAEAWSDFVLPK